MGILLWSSRLRGRSGLTYILKIRDAIDTEAELGIGAIPYGEKQPMCLMADISKLTEHTGFVPLYSFEDGISETVKWAREVYLDYLK